MKGKKQKPEGELEEEQLEDVTGGFIERFPNVPLEESTQDSPSSPLIRDVPKR